MIITTDPGQYTINEIAGTNIQQEEGDLPALFDDTGFHTNKSINTERTDIIDNITTRYSYLV